MSKKRLNKGPLIHTKRCPKCKGSGYSNPVALLRGNDACDMCRGKGVVHDVSDPDAAEKQGRLRGQ